MAEAWQAEAARRFNDTIRMTPAPEPPKLQEREPETLVDLAELVWETQVGIYRAMLDPWGLRN